MQVCSCPFHAARSTPRTAPITNFWLVIPTARTSFTTEMMVAPGLGNSLRVVDGDVAHFGFLIQDRRPQTPAAGPTHEDREKGFYDIPSFLVDLRMADGPIGIKATAIRLRLDQRMIADSALCPSWRTLQGEGAP